MDARRILIIRFSSIGDIILTTPLLNAIKKGYPEATIDYLTLAEFSSLLKDNPFINNLITIERKKSVFYYLKKTIDLRKKNYNYIFDLHKSARSLIFRLIIKSWKKNKIKKKYLKRLLLTYFKIDLYEPPYSVIERYYKTAGIEHLPDNAGTEIYLGIKEIQNTVKKLNNIINNGYSLRNNLSGKKIRIETGLFNKKNKIISLMPFAKWKTKEWGDENFSELGRLISKKTGSGIHIFGGAGDATRAKAIADGIGLGAISLAGKLSLPETAAALSVSDCLVSNDTGVMHMGGAVNIPVIAIFGCTTEQLGFFPVNKKNEIIQVPLKCRPCTAKGLSSCPEKHFKCMKDIPVEMVYEAVIKYIS
jgi:lipopolysaccharide heptosyltransferase II